MSEKELIAKGQVWRRRFLASFEESHQTRLRLVVETFKKWSNEYSPGIDIEGRWILDQFGRTVSELQAINGALAQMMSDLIILFDRLANGQTSVTDDRIQARLAALERTLRRYRKPLRWVNRLRTYRPRTESEGEQGKAP